MTGAAQDNALYVRLIRRRAGNGDPPGPWQAVSLEGPAIGADVPMEMRVVADAVNRPAGEIESAVFRVAACHLKKAWPEGPLPSTLARKPTGPDEPDQPERSDDEQETDIETT